MRALPLNTGPYHCWFAGLTNGDEEGDNDDGSISHSTVEAEELSLGGKNVLTVRSSCSCCRVFTPIAARYTRINTSLNDSIMNEGDRDE